MAYDIAMALFYAVGVFSALLVGFGPIGDQGVIFPKTRARLMAKYFGKKSNVELANITEKYEVKPTEEI